MSPRDCVDTPHGQIPAPAGPLGEGSTGWTAHDIADEFELAGGETIDNAMMDSEAQVGGGQGNLERIQFDRNDETGWYGFAVANDEAGGLWDSSNDQDEDSARISEGESYAAPNLRKKRFKAQVGQTGVLTVVGDGSAGLQRPAIRKPRTESKRKAISRGGGEPPQKTRTTAESRDADFRRTGTLFNFGKAPLKSISRLLNGQHGWVRYFQLHDFLSLPWQKDCSMDARAEFISNYDEAEANTVVNGKVIDLSLESLGVYFKLHHGNTRIQKDSAYVSTNIMEKGHHATGYLVSFAKKHWVPRYEVLLPLLFLKNPKRHISKGVAEWVEVKSGFKDTAHTLFRHMHKELKRLRGSTATDARSLITPIGPHVALLILGTEGHLLRDEALPETTDLHDGLKDIQLAMDHLVAAQRTFTDKLEQAADDDFDNYPGGKAGMWQKISSLEADLLKSQQEVATVNLKCKTLKKAANDAFDDFPGGKAGMLQKINSLEADLLKSRQEVATVKRKCETLKKANMELMAFTD